MKIFVALFIMASVFVLSACPVQNAYLKETYETQSSYNEIFKNKTVPDDVRYNN